MKNIYNKFLNEKIIIPFGRIMRGGILKHPRNESMIGRKGQRKYLISWLLEPKKNGAFLITGNRGSGKTSFVNHCISKYNINLYSRLVQNEVNFKFFDYFLIACIISFCSLLLTLAVSVITLQSSHFFITYVVWPLLLIPFIALANYSLLFFKTRYEIQRSYQKENPKTTWLERLLIFRFLLLTTLSSTIITYGLTKIFIGIYKTPFINTLLFFDFQVLYISILVFLNKKKKKELISKGNSSTLTKRFRKLLILSWIITLVLFLLIEFKSSTYPLLFSLITYQKLLVEGNEGYWFSLISLTFLFLSFYEYSNFRIEFEKDTSSTKISKEKERLALISQWSIPVLVIKHYIPTITISLNMGFQNLQHSNIIHAMLVDLRTKYREIFLGKNHLYNNILPIVVAFLSVLVWNVISGSSTYTDFVNQKNQKNQKPFYGKRREIGKVNTNKKLLRKLFSNFKDTKKNQTQLKEDKEEIPIMLSMLDISGMMILFIVFYTFLYYRPLTKSRKNLAKLDNLLNKLSSKITKSTNITNSIKHRILQISRSDSLSLETNPTDSRIIEIEMLDLLNDIRQDKGSWFLSPGNVWTIPATSIIFVFDELDKLHNHGEDLQKRLEEDIQKNYSRHEAARTYQINKLLSDIKNFINTAPAKFIFVAGRDLHDQWLADTNSRENFLTSIFDSEIYIPSLLTDHSSANENIKSNIVRYVNTHYKKAEFQFCNKNKNNIRNRRKNQLKYYQLFYTDQKNLAKTFVEDDNIKSSIESLCNNLMTFQYTKEEPTQSIPLKVIYKEKFLLDFIRFLTYRSQGNPKQLERNLFGFSRPNYLKKPELKDDLLKNWDIEFLCANALHFGDHEIFRIQFIAELYQQIDNKVGNYILQTDDKMAMAVFYLSDFIMKFHDSSFSWRHLIRLDELAHIHRLPDLSNVFKRMVQHFSGIYLHRVLNGIFTYRFRSDISKEITYLSKISSVENASFNFTLDESGDLKSIFRRKIKDKNRDNWDLTSGLGDLFELDGEFDDARHQYIGAIKILDKQYQLDHGENDLNALHKIFTSKDNDIDKSPVRLNVKWMNERLSLMLLIGLTYEKEGRLTAALSHYRDTKSLATIIFKNFIGIKNDYDKFNFNNNKQHNRNEVLKHFNILYQPIFAEAWLVEKLMGGIDTSLAIVEKGVKQIRNALPFIGNIKNSYITSSAKVPHSNFAILASSLHNKVGDLAFFKGGQEKYKNLSDNTKADNTGYLHRAMFHYALALHELRRFINYRYISSGIKYNPHLKKKKKKATISESSRPDFINLTFASNLIDLGESCLAKVNLVEIFNFSTPKAFNSSRKCDVEKTKNSLINIINSWASKSNSDCNKESKYLELFDENGNVIFNFGTLHDWFGNWNVALKNYDSNLLKFKTINSNIQRLFAGILLTWVGIDKMKKGGYLESATKEYMELANAILNIVWWYSLLSSNGNICKQKRIDRNKSIIIQFLLDFSISCLEDSMNASLTNRTSVISPKRNINAKGTNPEFNKIMPEIITTTYSAQLLINNCKDLNIKVSDYKLFADIAKYTDTDTNSKNISKMLVEHLNYNRYPMLNRLRGLSILVYCSGINKCDGDIGDLTTTIINYNDTYDAPFHYTYLELGICAYLAWKESIVKAHHLDHFLTNFKDFIKLSNISISELHNKIKENKVHIQSTDININDLYNLITRNKKYIQLKGKNGDSVSESKNKYVEIKNEIINTINNKIEDSLKTEERTKTWFKNIANQNLENSIGSHSMGKSYYENITKLYYLYDDFNDRRIHLNQAMQMLGTSVAEDLLDKLNKN